MAGANITVQPPSQAQASQTLYPPVIVNQSVQVEPFNQYFATAILLDEAGTVIDSLGGIKAATGFQLDESSGSTAMVYAFTNLSISKSGSYTIRLDLYQLPTDSQAGATLVEQLQTNTIKVSDGDVPRTQPSSDDLAQMDRARDAGIQLPSP